ncbi:MAG: alkaline phosphatase family protein [Nocardioides sp.]|nr:alkaline phosphatase family protein [Nocardioides sp.]
MSHEHCSRGSGDAAAPFARPLGRRQLLQLGAAGTAGIVLSTAIDTPALAAKGKKRAYVLVLDGMIPSEIDSGLMPNLKALRDGGTHFPRARALPILETLPNHVMMMTGVRPNRNGVPANVIYDRKEKVHRDLDRPEDLRYPTLIERMNRRGFSTGTVLSKEYLYGIFGDRATHRWEPAPIIPVSGHAPDVFTGDALRSMITEHDPNLVFVSFGDCDRMGHVDLTGPVSLKVLRQTALVQLDQQVGMFIDQLKSTGRWENSLVLGIADHSMDWSRPDRVISLTPPLSADPFLAGKFEVSQNGGADLLYWTGPRGQRDEALKRMRRIARNVPGVLAVRRPGVLRLGARAGDLVVFCKAGWRFSDPEVHSNPIPGNHGHPATRPIPFFISGGHPVVRRRTRSVRATTVDVAPTVGAFFGLGTPRGGYDGTSRL